MDASRFLTHNDGFRVLDLVGSMAFKSHASISFALRNKMWNKGWIDIHHPCDGHIKARLRVQIKDDYLTVDKMQSIIETVFDALGIPRDETFEAEFFSASAQHGIEQANDRDGMTDRLY